MINLFSNLLILISISLIITVAIEIFIRDHIHPKKLFVSLLFGTILTVFVTQVLQKIHRISVID